MSTLRLLLSELEKLLIEKNIASRFHFKAGYERATIADVFESRDLTLVEDLVDLYGWHNGIDSIAEVTQRHLQLSPHVFFEPLESSFATYDEMCRSLPLPRLKSVFPLFTDGGGIYYLIDIDPQSPEFKMIIEMNPGSIEFDLFISKYDDLNCFIKSVIHCYQKDVYYLNEGELSIDVDQTLEFEIHKRMNPKSQYWMLYS